MIEFICILFAFVVYFLLSKLSSRYFEWLYQKHAFNAIDIQGQFMGMAFFTPLFIGLWNEDIGFNPIVLIGIPCMIFVVMCVRNAKIKNPILIATTSLIQIFYACTFILRVFVWLCLCIASFVKAIYTGTGFEVKYNPIINNKFENNKLVQTKKEFSFTPEPGPGIMDNIGIYTYDLDSSRIMAERNRLENELADVQNRKYEAMSYGFDIADYEMREKSIKNEIASLPQFK